MMNANKRCARCEKTVYTTEELKCLDKVWHKLCFKCKDCGMALNMRNYKGFNKEPYCEAHVPKAKATTMAETPELKRIAENTKLQSNVNYHADFEKSKGKFTQVADDPETLRIKQNTRHFSNVAYHGDIQRKAEMEHQRRQLENGNSVGAVVPENSNNLLILQPPTSSVPSATTTTTFAAPAAAPLNPALNIGKIADYDAQNHQFVSPYSARTSQTLIYNSEMGATVIEPMPMRQIGSVHDMDPVNHNYGSLGVANSSQESGEGGATGLNNTGGRIYRALYDYDAQDEDEVSFRDGDLIVNVSSIDRGWMTGQVQRTGQVGMLPANYVQLANNI